MQSYVLESEKFACRHNIFIHCQRQIKGHAFFFVVLSVGIP